MIKLAAAAALTLTALAAPANANAAPVPATCNPSHSMNEEEWAQLDSGMRFVRVNEIVGYSGKLVRRGVVDYAYCDVRYPEARDTVRATFTLQGGQWLVSDLVSPWAVPQ